MGSTLHVQLCSHGVWRKKYGCKKCEAEEKTVVNETVVSVDDDVPDAEDGKDAVRRLGIDVTSWASDIRARVARAAEEWEGEVAPTVDSPTDLKGLREIIDLLGGIKDWSKYTPREVRLALETAWLRSGATGDETDDDEGEG